MVSMIWNYICGSGGGADRRHVESVRAQTSKDTLRDILSVVETAQTTEKLWSLIETGVKKLAIIFKKKKPQLFGCCP
jgi:hypothetical protein